MKGVDYTKQLAKERDYFQEAIQKNKAASEKRVSDNDQRNELVQTKQRENFIEDKAELESSYQKTLNHLKDKTQASIESSNSKSNNQMEKEREAFTQESLTKRKDFDQRLNDIKSSYKKAFESEKDIHGELQKSQHKRYSTSLNDVTTKTDSQLKEYQDKMQGRGADLKDQYSRERQQLVRSQEDNLTALQKDNAFKRADLKDRIETDIAKSKKIHVEDVEGQKQYTQDRLSSMQNKYENRFQDMAQDYSVRSDNLADTQRREAVKINKENNENIADVRRDFNKQMRLVELDKRRRDNGSGEFSEVMKRQQGVQDQSSHDREEDKLKKQLVEAQRTYQARAGKEQDAHNEALLVQSTESTANLDRKLNELNADKIVTVSNEREKAQAQISNRELQNRTDRLGAEQKLSLEKTNANERLTNLKENFNKSMKAMEENLKLSLEDVTRVSNDDKSKFVKELNEKRSNEIFQLKREFNKTVDATVQGYEQKLGAARRENEMLKMTMDQKIQNIVDQTDKKLSSQTTLFENRRVAETKDQQMAMDEREHKLKTDMNTVIVNFQKKLDKMQVDSDLKLKLLTNDYETKLKDLAGAKNKEIALKESTLKHEVDTLKKASEDEKARLISAYETQVASMKASHLDSMNQLKEFKKLS